MKITPHLDTDPPDNTQCHDGCGAGTKPEHYDPKLLWLIEEDRQVLDRPVHPTSMARCPVWNRHEGGEDDSAHVTIPEQKILCRAGDLLAVVPSEKLDIVIVTVLNAALPAVSVEAKREMWHRARKTLRGLGIGPTFVHIGVDYSGACGYAIWTYPPKS